MAQTSLTHELNAAYQDGDAQALAALLEDPRAQEPDSSYIRGSALTRLAKLQDPVAVPYLIRLLSGESVEEYRIWAIRQLGAYGGPSGVEALNALVESAGEPSFVRACALDALAVAGDASSRIPAQAAIRDPDAPIRARACKVLGKIGGPSVIPSLTQALDDPNGRVRETASRMLAQIAEPDAADALESAASQRGWFEGALLRRDARKIRRELERR